MNTGGLQAVYRRFRGGDGGATEGVRDGYGRGVGAPRDYFSGEEEGPEGKGGAVAIGANLS